MSVKDYGQQFFDRVRSDDFVTNQGLSTYHMNSFLQL